MPNATKVRAGLVDLAVETKLITQLVHQVHATEAGAHNQHFGLEVVRVDIGRAAHVGVVKANVLPKRHLSGKWKQEIDSVQIM